ncbi:MAG TPA: ABC transporter substrate binding protein [Paucimonas sp.]|nr:ABC transporter substrate binding protein [Paucimonas sp.]
MRFLLLFLLFIAGAARADIILLLSDERAPVTGVARAIGAAYGGKIEVHNLGGSRGKENDIVRAILNSNRRQVVAVGLLAAQVARERLPSKHVVFCQVLNFEEFDLVTPWMKGVSGIPSLQKQFAAWKMLDPGLQRIGVITGRQTRYMVREAEAAARRQGIDIIHIEAASDRAVLFAAQELQEKKIQGLWLAPDSSILSQRAILELMSYSVKNNLEVLAFSPALLKEGALLSATSDFSEIAQLVLERLRKASDATGIAGEPVMPLGAARIHINGAAAARFGLSVSAKLREQADVQ